jgi:hypothetical protein
VGRPNLRSWNFSNVYATGTSGRAGARVLPAQMALIFALVLATGLTSASVLAAIDLTSGVGVHVLARPASASTSDEAFELRDGGVLRSGDGVQLRIESDADAYVYVVAYGSSHTAILLQPFSGRPEDARIQPGRVKVIPGPDVYLPLDGREGRESLFTIVSERPLEDIGDLLARIEAHGDDLGAITAMIGTTYPGARRLSFKHIGARPLVGVAAAPRTASVGASAGPAVEPRAGDAGDTQSGATPLPPPAAGGWSVSSEQGFGTRESAGETAKAASGTPADPAASTQATGASTATTGSDPVPVSSALHRAREAAGIDESAFRGILATLPEAGQAAVPAAVRGPYEEQGVLSAEGSRIRPLGNIRLDSDADKRSQN